MDPFGFGLSYTTFGYDGLAVSPSETSDGRVTVSFDVTNTGKRPGSDVAQLYVADTHSDIARPPRELKGFAKVSLAPGETQRVTIELDRRSFAYYDVEQNDWQVAPGEFRLLIGQSSRNIVLEGTVTYSD